MDTPWSSKSGAISKIVMLLGVTLDVLYKESSVSLLCIQTKKLYTYFTSLLFALSLKATGMNKSSGQGIMLNQTNHNDTDDLFIQRPLTNG